MATLAFVLAAVLDPVQAGIVLAIILVHRGPHPVVVAGVMAAILSETATVLAADNYMWGELIAPRAASSLMQAAILGWVVRLVRQIRVGGDIAPTGVSPSGGNATASLTAGSLPSASRLSPWHMRAYVRRQMEKLRSR
jgi:hypothetical protein